MPGGLAVAIRLLWTGGVQVASRLALPGYRLSGAAVGAVVLGIGGVIVIQIPAVREVHLGVHAGLGAGLVVLGAILCAAVNVIGALVLASVALANLGPSAEAPRVEAVPEHAG